MERVMRVRDRPGAPHPYAGADRDAADTENHFDRLEAYRVQQQYFVQRQVGSGPARPDGAAVLAYPEQLAQLAQVGLFVFRAAQRCHVRAHDAKAHSRDRSGNGQSAAHPPHQRAEQGTGDVGAATAFRLVDLQAHVVQGRVARGPPHGTDGARTSQLVGFLERDDHVARPAPSRAVILHVAALDQDGRAAGVSDGAGHKTDLDQLGQLVTGQLGGPRLLRGSSPVDHYGRAVQMDLAALVIGGVAHLRGHPDHPVRPQVSRFFEHPVQGHLVSRRPGAVQRVDPSEPARVVDRLFVAGTWVSGDRIGGIARPARESARSRNPGPGRPAAGPSTGRRRSRGWSGRSRKHSAGRPRPRSIVEGDYRGRPGRSHPVSAGPAGHGGP